MVLRTIILSTLFMLAQETFAQPKPDEEFLNIVWPTLVNANEFVHYLAPYRKVYFTPTGGNVIIEQGIIQKDFKGSAPISSLKEITDILYKDTVSERWDFTRLRGLLWGIADSSDFESGQISVRYIISKALFDQQKKYCLIYCIYDCGSECASGTYFLYRKEKDTWILIKSVQRYIS